MVAQVEIVLILLVVVAALVALARRIGVPYPILLVLGGLVLGFAPLPRGVSVPRLEPDLVFVLFLPPLLYWASLTSSYRDLRANARSISLLSVGLVVATCLAVAAVAHAAIGLPWGPAFVLGAVVSPTDTLAAEVIASRLGLPRRLLTVLSGESLINDATALVTYRTAVAAVTTGTFVAWQAARDFLLVSLGGVAVGLAVGWAIYQVRRRQPDPATGTLISLISGFAAYIPADRLGVSGVLAVLAMGLYLGRQGPRIVSSQTRLQTQATWGVVVFILNGLLFILVGLELSPILDALALRPLLELARDGAVVSLTVMAVRLAWVFPGTYLPRFLSRRVRARDPYPPWQSTVIVGWTGMRGATSLASALAIPLAFRRGPHGPYSPFPDRDLIIFLAFSVILSTLVVQGLTLPALIRRLRLPEDMGAEHEESKARLLATRAAMARIDELARRAGAPADLVDDLKEHYADNDRRFTARFKGTDEDRAAYEGRAESYRRLRRELLEVERGAVVDLRNRGVINDEVMSRVQRDIDLEEVRQEA